MAQATQVELAERLKKISIDYVSAYDLYVESLKIPVYTGYYVEDVRTLELGWWSERQCYAAVLKLAGNENVTESRVSEIEPGKTLPAWKFGLDEIVYVASGRGLARVWTTDERDARTFEFQDHSLFLIPRNSTYQLSNASGVNPLRLLHFNYLPMAMNCLPDPEAFFNNPGGTLDVLAALGGEAYSEAKVMGPGEGATPGLSEGMAFWVGNFFPDMRAWDRLVPFRNRGAGGHVVWIRFPGSTFVAHMSVFPALTYKKAHRHGPGTVIVIPAGEGFSVMWPEGQDKVFIPWHEASVFVPPNRWYHQHFNVGQAPGRYLAFHGVRGFTSERLDDRLRDQIEYPDEDPAIRKRFEEELARRGLKSAMPEGAYRDPTYQWTYEGD
ncbi:MAG TPA: cupin domain-containing protein [Chloroflexota bacterium]|nr:cupin domain-containing protein [Chloroflexota bacterium]